MVKLDDLKTDRKYYAILNIPYLLYGPYQDCGIHSVRIKVLKLKPREYEYMPDYVTIQLLESSKNVLSECGRNPITVPTGWIKKIETLHKIMNTKTIDDVIYLIEQYV